MKSKIQGLRCAVRYAIKNGVNPTKGINRRTKNDPSPYKAMVYAYYRALCDNGLVKDD